MPDAGDSKRDEIARDILSYLLRNPSAADSFDGIARWRLLEEIARRSVASTESAMHWLIANNYLIEDKIPGGKAIYRLNLNRRKDAERLVGEDLEKKPDSDTGSS